MPSLSPIRRLLPTRGVCERYGQKAGRTIRRWVVAGQFPKPDKIINGRNYWWLQTLEQHERRAVTANSAAPEA
jgi:hypothetical protein